MAASTRTALMTGVGVALAGCFALAGCASSQDTAQPSQASSEAAPTSPSASAESSPATESNASSSDSTQSQAPTSPDPEASTGSELASLPENAIEYADALVVAWGNGNNAQMQQLATGEVITALTEHAANGGPHWSQTSSDAGAGSVFVSYENAQDGAVLNLRVQNQAAAQGQEQAVVEAKFE